MGGLNAIYNCLMRDEQHRVGHSLPFPGNAGPGALRGTAGPSALQGTLLTQIQVEQEHYMTSTDPSQSV